MCLILDDSTSELTEQIVDILHVEAKDNKGIDYNKLIEQFGSSVITPEQIAKIEQITGSPPHHFLRYSWFYWFSRIDQSFILKFLPVAGFL